MDDKATHQELAIEALRDGYLSVRSAMTMSDDQEQSDDDDTRQSKI